MHYVEIYEVENGKQQTLGRVVKGDDGTIEFVDIPDGLIEIMKEGILWKGVTYTPKDGMRFLFVLQHEFSGSMVRASGIMEG